MTIKELPEKPAALTRRARKEIDRIKDDTPEAEVSAIETDVCEHPWEQIAQVSTPVLNSFTSPMLDSDNLLVMVEDISSDAAFNVQVEYATVSDPSTFYAMGTLQDADLDASALLNTAIYFTGLISGRVWAQASKTAPDSSGIGPNAFGPSRGGAVSPGEQVVKVQLTVSAGEASGLVRFLTPCGRGGSDGDASRLIAGGWTLLMKSDGGTTWSDVSVTLPNSSGFYAGATDGAGSVIALSLDKYIIASHDYGDTWNTSITSNLGANQWGRAAAYGGGTFIAGGYDNGLVYSTDLGGTWTATDAHFHDTAGTGDIYCATWGNGTFVAAGDGGKVATSPDGINWTQRSSGTTEPFSGAGYGAGTFLIVGQTIHRSLDDGVTWEDVTPVGVGDCSAVAYSDALSRFVVTAGPDVWISDDLGDTWTHYASVVPAAQQAIAWAGGPGLFASVGLAGYICTSPDGIAWTQRDHSHNVEYDMMLAV
jgi:hypothetical protein